MRVYCEVFATPEPYVRLNAIQAERILYLRAHVMVINCALTILKLNAIRDQYMIECDPSPTFP